MPITAFPQRLPAVGHSRLTLFSRYIYTKSISKASPTMNAFTRFSAVTVLLASAVSAQEQYTINPNTVSNATRRKQLSSSTINPTTNKCPEFWCSQQQSQCPLICGQTSAQSETTETNSCDANALQYACVCANGQSPNISQYSQTLPFFICQEWGNQCVSNCDGDTSCASDCRSQHPCGAQDPFKGNKSTAVTTTSSAAPGSNTAIYSGFAGQSGGSGGSGQSNAAAAVKVWALGAGQTFGTLAVVGGFLGGFALLL